MSDPRVKIEIRGYPPTVLFQKCQKCKVKNGRCQQTPQSQDQRLFATKRKVSDQRRRQLREILQRSLRHLYLSHLAPLTMHGPNPSTDTLLVGTHNWHIRKATTHTTMAVVGKANVQKKLTGMILLQRKDLGLLSWALLITPHQQ